MACSFDQVNENTIVFCDSKIALEWAFQNGLSHSAKIYTSASSILSSDDYNCEDIEKKWTTRRIKNFRDCVYSTSLSISSKLARSTGISESDALMVSSSFLGSMATIYKAGCLCELDISKNKVLVDIENLGSRDRNLISLWPKIFNGIDNTQIVLAPVTLEEFSGLTVDGVSFWRRLEMAGAEGVLFRLLSRMSALLRSVPTFKKRGLVYNPNELVQEVAVSLFAHGDVLTTCPIPTEKTNDHHRAVEKIATMCSREVKPFISKWVPPSLVANCVTATICRIVDDLSKKYRYENFFLNSRELAASDYILSGALPSIEGRALSSSALKLGVPLIACHHGVTHEINDAVSINAAAYDDALSDLTVTHTQLAATHLEKQPYSRGKRFAAGLPKRVFRTSALKGSPRVSAKALYISTFLLHGNSKAPLISFARDKVRDEIEAKFVKDALSISKARIDFKPYPEEYRRFTEPSLATTFARNSKNIRVVHSDIDARFVIRDYPLLITSGATSTLGWAFASNTPLIFINWKDHLPINKTLINSLRDALFYFDGDAPDFHANFIHFIEKDIGEIRELWEEKSSDRQIFLHKYISENTSEVGKLVAERIHNFVDSFQFEQKRESNY